jgi:hypothetical protein
VAAPLVIQDSSEDTGRVESGEAKPIYRPVLGDQSGGVKVTYDPVIFYWEVAHVGSRKCRRCRLAYILPYHTATGKDHLSGSRPLLHLIALSRRRSHVTQIL